MKSRDIKQGETYMFMATDSVVRKNLEGTEFTVINIQSVWRRRFKQSRRVKRFFNQDGIGARAEELEPLDSKITTENHPDEDLPF